MKIHVHKRNFFWSLKRKRCKKGLDEKHHIVTEIWVVISVRTVTFAFNFHFKFFLGFFSGCVKMLMCVW